MADLTDFLYLRNGDYCGRVGQGKGGTSPLNEVIEYAKPITKHGLVFMDSPGLDPCSATWSSCRGTSGP